MLKTIEARETADTIQAVFDTTLGSFTIQLFHKRAPKTVQNFIDLAEGTTESVTTMDLDSTASSTGS